MTVHRQVSAGRKLTFYCGYLSMAAGAVFIVSIFFSGLDPFTWSRVRALVLRVVLGVGCFLMGLLLRKIGIRGLAGSVVILSPPGAREDLEPWSRAAGGLVNAALSEVEAVKKISGGLAEGKEAIRVRCRSCRALNDEEARYCSQCGKEI